MRQSVAEQASGVVQAGGEGRSESEPLPDVVGVRRRFVSETCCMRGVLGQRAWRLARAVVRNWVLDVWTARLGFGRSGVERPDRWGELRGLPFVWHSCW